MNKKKFIEVDLTIVNLEDQVILWTSGGDANSPTLLGDYTDKDWL